MQFATEKSPNLHGCGIAIANVYSYAIFFLFFPLKFCGGGLTIHLSGKAKHGHRWLDPVLVAQYDRDIIEVEAHKGNDGVN